MKKFLRVGVLAAAVLVWGGEAYAVTPEFGDAQAETTVDSKGKETDGKAKKKRDWGRLSGSFETNTIYYVEDEKTKAVVPQNSYGSNNYLKLDYQRGRFLAGVQLEYYPHPLVGSPAKDMEYLLEGFGWGNLAEKYVSWVDRNYSVTVGDFYEQFGSGLILRAWEDRTLNINNSIGGGRVTFNIKNILSAKVLYGFPRYYMEYLSTQIGGADLSLSLSNAFGMRDHMLSIEGSVVNRRENLPDWYYEYGYADQFNLSKNMLSYSGRLNYEYKGLLAKFEYVGKGKDIYIPATEGSDYELKKGNAQLVELGYTGDGFAVTAQFRRLSYMQTTLFRLDPTSGTAILPANTLNYVPAMSPQHTYMLAGLDPNVAKPLGEMGGQIDAFYAFKKGSTIGGKRGMKIHANYSLSYTLDGATTAPGNHFYYRDFTFDIDKSWNKKLRTILFVSLQKNALHEVGKYANQNIFVADVTYKFTNKFSLRAELQYNYAPGTEDTELIGGDWVGGLLEANFAPKWSIFVSDMYNNGNAKEKINYYSAGASFTHKFIRVAVTYGRNRAGMICSGGVCREMPAYTGGNLSMTLTF